MTNTVAGIHLGADTHANRPDATAVTAGSLYSCSDHNLVYRSDGSTWSTWATLGGSISDSQTFTHTGEVSTGTGTVRWYPPVDITIVAVRAAAGTAPTGADLIVDVNKNGTTIFSTQANRPTITDGNNVSSEETPDVTSVTDSDYLTIDIDQVGSSTAGSDLTVVVEYTVA